MRNALSIGIAFLGAVVLFGCARHPSIDTVLAAPGKYADRTLVSKELKLVAPSEFGSGLAASVTAAEKGLRERGIKGVTGVPALTPAGKRVELFLDLHGRGLVRKVQELCSAGVENVTVQYKVRIGPAAVADTEHVTLVDIKARE